MSENKQQNAGFEVSRRKFLKAGAAVAATAGVLGASQLAPAKVARAAFQSEEVHIPYKKTSGQNCVQRRIMVEQGLNML